MRQSRRATQKQEAENDALKQENQQLREVEADLECQVGLLQDQLQAAHRSRGGLAKALKGAQTRLAEKEHADPMELLTDLLGAMKDGTGYTQQAAVDLAGVMEAGELSFKATPRVLKAVIQLLSGGKPLPQVGDMFLEHALVNKVSEFSLTA